jgi:hypothetical protein
MRAKRLNFKKVLNLVKTYMQRRGQALLILSQKPSKRGRPRQYPDEIILTMLFLQTAWNLSFRDAEAFAKMIFGEEEIPDYSTYYYRLKTLPSLLVTDFIDFLSERPLKRYRNQIVYFIIDGTGFKYDDLYPLKILRGTQIKEVRSHVKAVILSSHLANGKRFVVSIALGKSYANELKLGEEILEWIGFNEEYRKVIDGKPLIGDKGYDRGCLKIAKTTKKAYPLSL